MDGIFEMISHWWIKEAWISGIFEMTYSRWEEMIVGTWDNLK